MSSLFYFDSKILGSKKTGSNFESGSADVNKSVSLNDGPAVSIGGLQSIKDIPLVQRASVRSVNQVEYASPIFGSGRFRIEINFKLSQPVNQWLCIVLLGCITLSVVLFYFTSNAEIIGENITGANAEEVF